MRVVKPIISLPNKDMIEIQQQYPSINRREDQIRAFSSPSPGDSSQASSLSELSSFERFGLGCNKWSRLGEGNFETLIGTAISNGVCLIETGQEGGEEAFAKAYRSLMEKDESLSQHNITVTARFGYRSVTYENSNGENSSEAPSSSINLKHTSNQILPTDVPLEIINDSKGDSTTQIMHNISSSFLHETLLSSPLVELQKDFPQIKLQAMLFNPEVQVKALLESSTDGEIPELRERQIYIQQKLASGLEALEDLISSGSISACGITSNGLGLPSSHPLHLSVDTVLNAKSDRMTAIELPANLLERQGLDVAREIRSQDSKVEIWAMRPLTCFPDLGTGSTKPFALVDYSVPDPQDPTKQLFTNQLDGPPAIYQVALQTAMSHFDAQFLIEAKQERELTTEERETLDGCKLVQSMLHDLDNNLEHVRSFAAHEEELFDRIIPLLFDTFEEVDEDTATVLQTFFAAYGVAVRHAIAKRTRQLLTKGGDKELETDQMGKTEIYPDLPDRMTLQEFAFRSLLSESVFDRIIVGASSPTDLMQNLEAFQSISQETGSPMEACQLLKQKEGDESGV